jgi:hypothetical protein
MVDREQDGIALLERHYLRARLHPRALFGEHEFSAREVVSGL